MAKFKVGDKVKVLRNSSTLKEKDQMVGKEFEILSIQGEQSERAEAKCSPSNTFGFAPGAKLAFERLIGKDKPTVREAEVGEYICMVKDHGGDMSIGSIHRCVRRGVFGPGYLCSFPDAYVVLENYDPELDKPAEPEKPAYYNGKVVCVKSQDSDFTVGKVYEFVDGKAKDNDGDKRPACSSNNKTLADCNDFGYTFIEYKGEQQ